VKSIVLRAITASLLITVAVHASPASTGAIPDDMRELAQKAADAFKADHFEDAAAIYHTIIRAHPDSLYAWSNLGVVRFQQGNYREARKALEQAVALNPKDGFCLGNLGIVDVELKSYNDAIKALEAAIAVNPNDAMTHYYLSRAYDNVGRHADAERELKKTRELQSRRPPLENTLPQPKVLT
jgi:tetratricopeptide (TPR) repeat protein